MNRYASPAVHRALDVLGYVSAHGSCSLTEAVRELGLSKSTAYGLLLTLEERGYLRRDVAGRYRLGLELVHLGTAVLASLDVRKTSEPFMARLAEETQETCHLGVLSGSQIVYIAKAESPLAVKLTSQIGQTQPLHSTSLGKILLASLPEAEQAALIKRVNFEVRTPRTILRPALLEQALVQIRAQGFAVDDEENTLGVRCVAAPVHNSTGRVIAAVSTSGPADRLTLGRVPAIARAVVAACNEISAALGYQAP